MANEIIKIPWRITREFITNNRRYTFVYSTNVFGGSIFGQASQAANEPNCYGVPVRFRFCRSNLNSYFSDDGFEIITKTLIDTAIAVVPRDKPIIVFHKIGEGDSGLKWRAPKTFAYLRAKLKEIEYPHIQWDYYA